MPPYLLDANFFIEAHRASYPMDVFPSYWERIRTMANTGQIGSIDKGANQIVASWIHHMKDLFPNPAGIEYH